jgi:uncharacterized membrane protein YhaH (DUF805 family)
MRQTLLRQFRRREFWLLFGLLSTFGIIMVLVAIILLVQTGGLFGLW